MATWKDIRFRCLSCDGTGACPGHGVGSCLACDGTGYTRDSRLEVQEDDRLDSIIAEQADLRADLTVVLTNIWNKVKNL